MTAETLATGTRVARTTHPHIRGTVAGYTRSSMVVRVDDGGSHTGPAHHQTWRALTAEELAEELPPVDDQAAARAAGYSPDLLRAAAQGILANQHQVTADGTGTTLGCSCGAHQLSVTRYVFDDQGRADERVLWAVVEIIEHTTARDDSHSFTAYTV